MSIFSKCSTNNSRTCKLNRTHVSNVMYSNILLQFIRSVFVTHIIIYDDSMQLNASTKAGTMATFGLSTLDK